MAKDLLILTTGGTFDKRYPEGQWVTEFTFPPGQQSAVTEILKRARMDADAFACEWLFAEDSTKITDAQRDIIADRCASATQRRIVVTHGTDTMTRRIDPATGKVANTPNTATTIAARRALKRPAPRSTRRAKTSLRAGPSSHWPMRRSRLAADERRRSRRRSSRRDHRE